MAFTPPSSIPVAVGGGLVQVTNFPADQAVHFNAAQHVDVDNFPAVQTVDVDNFPASQPVTVDSLPLPDGATTEATAKRAAATLNDVALTAILERERMATE